MKKLMVSALLAVAAMTSFAQNEFRIHGKIELLTKSSHIRLSGYDPVPIQSDGSFEIAGEIDEPHIVLICTDSSGADAVWLAPGEYTISAKEIVIEHDHTIGFRTPLLKGPADAELYNDFQIHQYGGYTTPDQKGLTPATGRTLQKEGAIRYMDSVFTKAPHSATLPSMVGSIRFFVGDEATIQFIQKLDPEFRKKGEITMIANGFQRKEKIKAERTFENFTLTDQTGAPFSLASLSGKKAILIDFWSSECAPCRMGHPRMKEWWAKYAAKGLQIISISIDNDKVKWLKAVKEDGIGDWINLCDFHGFKAPLMQDYYIPYIPFRFLLDKDKRIVLLDNMNEAKITEKDLASLLDAP